MSGAGPEAAGRARLFIALWPDSVLRDAISAWCETWQWNAQAKRVPAAQLHLTLHFLGDVPRERLPALRQALGVPFATFSLLLGRPAVWPGQMAVLEPERMPPHLQRLQAALGAALQSLALPTEARGFRPHVTIARRAGSAVPPAAGLRLHWPVRGYALVESRPQPQGGYAVLKTWP